MSIDHDESERLATLLDVGRVMEASNYATSRDLVSPLQGLFNQINPELIGARGLTKFLEVESDSLYRIICLPSTTLMAIRHLTHDTSLTLKDFYELGIYSQINDRQTEKGEEKGFPSFHYKMLDTYLRYALEFAKVAGLYGGLITNFEDLNFAKKILKNGALIVSVDNQFISEVMNPNLDSSLFKPSRHAELIHGVLGNDLLISDVSNFSQGMTWNAKNRLVPRITLEKYLSSPRLNDHFTRAIMLTDKQDSWLEVQENLKQEADCKDVAHNPILLPHFGQGVKAALAEIRPKAEQGLAQWEMI